MRGPRRPLRLWPGIVVAVLVVLLRFVVPILIPGTSPYGFLVGFAGLLLVLLWWVFFSRAAWVERLGAVVVTVVAFFAIKPLLHPSIAMGMMGMMFALYAMPPVVAPAFVGWAVATRGLSDRVRRASMIATILLACGGWTLVRTDGITGDGVAQLAWRWTKTPEQRLLDRAHDVALPRPAAAPASASKSPDDAASRVSVDKPAASAVASEAAIPDPRDRVEGPAMSAGIRDPGGRVEGPAMSEAAIVDPRSRVEWPGFRGPLRDGIVRGVRIETDWSASRPVELWRRPIGPGWSSFAVAGDLLYTQEQRGQEEIVASYRVATGEPVWAHRDPVRFWESNAGPGPRATPTLHAGRVYAFGATGILNALDAATGTRIWSRDVAADAGREVPMWGFASSPLVVDGLVIIAAAGKLAAYDASTGQPRWFGPNGGGYSSPHLMTIGGFRQVVFLSSTGITGFDPSDGAKLWEHAWEGTPIVQPALMANGDVLFGSGDMMGGMGMRRLAVAKNAEGWSAGERWTSRGLKPYFNDFVVHEGHAYGFDGSILSCIGIEDGARKWKGGRYGQGQLILIADQDVLLVLSEDGELALVRAASDRFTELTRFTAIEGKTWNHPALVGDILLVRNGEEMAAFKLARAGRSR